MGTPVVPTPFDNLIDSASRGEQLVLAKQANGNRTAIQASDIGDLMRGVPRVTVPASPGGVNLQQLRAVRIKCAEIIGRLDLSGRREKPLPPIEFEDCVFKEEICLRGAWLSWVTFKSCRIVHLNAEECKIDCSVILDGIASSIEATQPRGFPPQRV